MTSRSITLVVIVVVVAILLLAVRFGSYDATTSEKETGSSYFIGGDLYAADSGLLNFNEFVQGDLFVASGDVVIAGGVLHDVNAIANDVVISSNVGDDIRVVANTLTISQDVVDSVLFFGETLILEPGSSVRGNIVGLGDSLVVKGTVLGDITFTGKSVTLTDTAVVVGSLYADVPSGDKLLVAQGAQVGYVKTKVVTEDSPEKKWGYLDFIWYLVAVTLFGLLLGLLFGGRFTTYREVRDEPLNSFAIGLSAILLTLPIVILMYLLFGSVVGTLALFLYGGLFAFAALVLPLFIGEMIQHAVRSSILPFYGYTAIAGAIIGLLLYSIYLSVLLPIAMIFILGVVIKKCYYQVRE